jgi:hypothetical protein
VKGYTTKGGWLLGLDEVSSAWTNIRSVASEGVDERCGKFNVWKRKFKVPVRMFLIVFK